ncbi:T9SS type A sorting domain-containing protein [Flavobacterium restrictum]|uniref:T9SS type A sorting domain-containing protein n=1 Tax=Flavobacterium restrictum TaxID=2594428 RepID=A0A553E8A5_9FLAO|nr:T9SS type A sorting domain-containing protein [Flavobacterium restrictum]TRX41298.1 T9SS type A sorting domain-containing protein [Flavobacterium restrictum]
MKKIYLLVLIIGLTTVSFAQNKSTGVVTMGTISLKIDLNQTTSLVTYTITGPTTKWFSIGLNTTSMTASTDCVTYGTALLDQSLPGGHVAPVTDATNNLTLVSNTISGTVRTIVATRPFNTSDAKDYTYAFSLTNLNVIYAIGSSTNVANQHQTFGSKTLTFTTVLGLADNTTLDKVTIYPNPSTGVFMISKNNATTVSKIKIFDSTARLVKEINVTNDKETTINLSGFAKGIYFAEIANEDSKVVKKLVIK